MRSRFQPSEIGIRSADRQTDFTARIVLQDDEYFDENADRSYSFRFNADGYDREEDSDSNGNVVGKFSYVDAAGELRTLNFRAGSETGYVPEADFLPKAPEFGQKIATFSAAKSSATHRRPAPGIQAPAATSRVQSFAPPPQPKKQVWDKNRY